ncbi:hypothetical protein C2S53_002937, partial [Perilla frutescens var. hirtella]
IFFCVLLNHHLCMCYIWSLSPIGGGTFEDGFGNAMHAEAIRSALNDVASSSKTESHEPGWTSSEDEADAMEQDEEVSGSDSERRKSFREHRKAHYDEFHKVRELLQKGPMPEDESDEEGKDTRGKHGRRDPSSSITAGVKDIDIEKSVKPVNGS